MSQSAEPIFADLLQPIARDQAQTVGLVAVPTSLASIEVGASARVVGIDGDGPVERRLRDLGFVPGTSVEVRRKAPLRDPVEFELRGTRLCLRRKEAARIRVIRA
jgi:Fe2+ transport system protein FeoA